MNTTLATLIVVGYLVGAVLFGRSLRRLLPGDHTESHDAVNLAMEAARRMWFPTCKAGNAVYSSIESNREKPHEPRHVRQLGGLVLWRACRHNCSCSRVGCGGSYGYSA